MKKKKNKNSSVFLDEETKNVEDLSLDDDIEQGVEIVNRNREELDNQRNKRIGKFERNANGQIIERPKIRYSVNTKAIVTIIVIIVVICWFLYSYGPIFGIHMTSVSENIEDNKIELVTKENDIYCEFNDELLVYSNNTISTYDNNANLTWSYTFSESFSPNIYVEGRYMLVTNNLTGMMYLFEGRNEILNKKLDGTIKSAFLDNYGNIAVEYAVENGYNNVVGVYNKAGRSLYDAYLSQENIISLKLIDNGRKLVFCEAVTDSSNIGIKFRRVDITKKEEEQLTDIVSLDNNFVYDFIVQGKTIYALLDDSIVSIDVDNGNINTLKEFNSTQMIFVSLNDDYYTFLERDISNNKYISENIGYSGNKISSTLVESVPKDMVSSNWINYYIYQDYVYILNKWGVDLGKREITFTPKKCIVFNNNKSLALVYTNKIYILNL